MDKITEFLESIDAEKNSIGAYIYTHYTGDSVNLYYLIKEYDEKSGWIDIYDRLPNKNQRCLVVLINGDITLDIYTAFHGGNYGFIHNVKYWMPLPEPPKNNNRTALSA